MIYVSRDAPVLCWDPSLRDDLVVDTMLLQECQHLRAPWELLQNRELGTVRRAL